jgi:dephospho-CoA kinase
MIVIGILGGVGSGKSTVAAELEKLGAVLIDADRVGHQVLAEPEVIAALRDRWGDDSIDTKGQINRRRVAKIVFDPGAAAELEFLEQRTHPRIGQILREQIDTARRQNHQAVVLDAAIMLKTGWDALCDHLLFVDVPEAIRQQRAMARGWTVEDFAAREASQTPLAEKKERADVVIDNSGSVGEVSLQIAEFWEGLSPQQPGV